MGTLRRRGAGGKACGVANDGCSQGATAVEPRNGSSDCHSPSSFQSPEDVTSMDGLVKQEHDKLVDQIFVWSRGFIIVFPMLASVIMWAGGQTPAQYLNPLIVSVTGFLPMIKVDSDNRWVVNGQIIAALLLISFPIVKHAVFHQGCSACLVPAIYGIIPCTTGFMFRTTQAIMVSTIYVVAVIVVIFIIDLTGNCPSEPMDSKDYVGVLADRLVPLMMLILGNSILVHVIIKRSQESMVLHAQAAQQAARLADLRRDVLHRVTHELRTPLNGLIGSVELLTTSETLTDELDMENVLTMQRCLTTILGICDDVLTVAKADNHNQPPKGSVKRSPSGAKDSEKDQDSTTDIDTEVDDENPIQSTPSTEKEETFPPFVLASVVDDVAELFGATVAAKGLALCVEFESNTTALYEGNNGTENKLRQILLNLVGNALKFTEEGSITIRVQKQQQQQAEDNVYYFEVEDTGVGIDPAESKMLFEPFHQGEQGGAVSRTHKGTGLGLTICRDLVAQLDGGDIGADGVRGVGSRFFFQAKLLPQQQQQQQSSVVPVDASQQSPVVQVLIVDSEMASRQCCQSIIQSVAQSAVDIVNLESHTALIQYLDETETRLTQQKTDTDNTVNNIGQSIKVALLQCDPADLPSQLHCHACESVVGKLFSIVTGDHFLNSFRKWKMSMPYSRHHCH